MSTTDEDVYYMAVAEEAPKGPYSMAELGNMLRGGQAPRDAMVIRKGSNQWLPITAVVQDAPRASREKVSASSPDRTTRTVQDALSQIPLQRILFMGQAMRMASDGRLFNKVASITVRIAAALWVVGTLTMWVKFWKIVSDLEGVGVLGGVVFQLVFLVGVYMITHVLLYRSSEMARQPASDFTIIPLISIFFRMMGDLYASFIMIVGVCGSTAMLLISDGDAYAVRVLMGQVSGILPGAGVFLGPIGGFGGGALLEALLLLLFSAVMAFISLVLFYFIAEFVLVLVDIARNIRVLRERGDSAGAGEGVES